MDDILTTENYLVECEDDELMALALSLRSSLQAIKREQMRRIYGGEHPALHIRGSVTGRMTHRTPNLELVDREIKTPLRLVDPLEG